MELAQFVMEGLNKLEGFVRYYAIYGLIKLVQRNEKELSQVIKDRFLPIIV